MEKAMEILRRQGCDPTTTSKTCNLQVPWLSGEVQVTMETVRVLGEGSFGLVSLVKLKDRYLAKKTAFVNAAEEDLRKELRILTHFRHVPNILNCFSTSLEFESIAGVRVCSLYLEYASFGTLADVIDQKGGRLPEYDVRRFTSMILRALLALHKEGYVHCDLKSTNVLAVPSRTLGETYQLKIADFGLAKEPGESCLATRTRMHRGTPPFMSPESLGPRGRIGSAMDIWSLGCVVLQMYGVDEAAEEDGGFFRWTVPEDISAESKQFVSKCMAFDPFDRWTAEKLITHPFVTEQISFFRM